MKTSQSEEDLSYRCKIVSKLLMKEAAEKESSEKVG